MTETLESKIRKLEGKTGPQNDSDDIDFQVYLVKTKGKKVLRRLFPDGKYKAVEDPETLGIAPSTPIDRPKRVISAPPVVIAVPASKVDPGAAIAAESADERLSRIYNQIQKDFHQ